MAMLLDEKILRTSQALSEKRIPHAFGGALALGYYGTPRGTIDIDINVFVDTKEARRILQVLGGLGIDVGGKENLDRIKRDGQARVHWDRTPIDLFFSYDELHTSCMGRIREVPFGDGDRIRILGAEDLVVFKIIFNRDKDWRDIEEMLFALGDKFDTRYVTSWLQRILEADDARLGRVLALFRGSAT